MTGTIRNKKQQRKIEIDRILREEPKQRRTTKAILRLLSTRVPRPQSGADWSVRTLRDDILEMRDAKAPITSTHYTDNAGVNHDIYHYTDSSYIWPDLNFDQSDLQSLQLALSILEPYSELPAVGHLRKMANRLSTQIEEGKSKKEGTGHESMPVYFSQNKKLTVKPEVWEPILDAASRRKILRFDYLPGWKRAGKPQKGIRVQPLALIQLENDWYLYALKNPGEYRQYRMERITSPKVSTEPFTPPSDLDVQDLLDHAFGRFIGSSSDERVTVKLRFKNKLTPILLADRIHPKQKIRFFSQGDMGIEFPVSTAGPSPMFEVVHWVRGFGDDVRVLEPKSLREAVSKPDFPFNPQG